MLPTVPRRALFAICLCLALPGCGDDEASQRKAFIAFLQTRILDKPGIHVAQPSAEEQKSWGDYAKHYAIITGFNRTLSERVSKPLQVAVQRGAVKSLQDLLDRRAELQAAGQGIGELAAELDRQFTSAQAARAGLIQPPDLKTVYDAAYERDVAGPARGFGEALPLALDAVAKSLALADLLAQNRARIKLDGALVQVADPGLQKEVQLRITAMNEAAQRVQAMQARLRALITGS